MQIKRIAGVALVLTALTGAAFAQGTTKPTTRPAPPAVKAPASTMGAAKKTAKTTVKKTAKTTAKKTAPARDAKGRFASTKKSTAPTHAVAMSGKKGGSTGATAAKKTMPARDPKTGRFIKKSGATR
jgi:DNA-binding protein HU-beta